MVGRNSPREKDQRRVAVALAQVAENLIISAILFDDVDDVFERRIFFPCRGVSGPVVRSCDRACKLHTVRPLSASPEQL